MGRSLGTDDMLPVLPAERKGVEMGGNRVNVPCASRSLSFGPEMQVTRAQIPPEFSSEKG